MNKKVSIIIPTYMRDESLKRAIESAVCQTYKNIEIIVVDDNKDDEYKFKVENIVKEFNDNRIILIKHKINLNGAVARNTGIRNSTGTYICFLDDDDEFLPSKIEKQVYLLEQLDSSYGAVSCLWTRFENNIMVDKGAIYSEDNLHKNVLKMKVKIMLPTVMFEKSKLCETGIFDINLKRHQDVQLFLDFLMKYKLKVMPDYLVKINTDSKINKLSAEKLIEVKKYFFTSMSKHMSIYNIKDQKNIKTKHLLEIAKVYLKEKNIIKFIEYTVKAKPNVIDLTEFMKEIIYKIFVVFKIKKE